MTLRMGPLDQHPAGDDVIGHILQAPDTFAYVLLVIFGNRHAVESDFRRYLHPYLQVRIAVPLRDSAPEHPRSRSRRLTTVHGNGSTKSTPAALPSWGDVQPANEGGWRDT